MLTPQEIYDRVQALPPHLKRQAVAALQKKYGDQALKRSGPRRSFVEYASAVSPKFVWYRHCQIVARQLQAVADGTCKRLIICMPPRHGKTELASRLLPAYFLDRHPNRFVAISSYGADLAYTISRNARDNYRLGGHGLSDTAAAVKHWETGGGGGLWAAGVGGPATGKGFHLGICDDPIKSRQDADSPLLRSRQRDWWQSVWYTRQEPGAALIVIATRWHEDDLVGWLLEQEEEGEHPERWTILNLEAVKGDEPPLELPATCELIEDDRRDGEALCPERYPIEKLRKIQMRIGEYNWHSLYGQRPRPPQGKFFQRGWFPIVDVAPAGTRWIRWWDKAATKDDGAYSAGVLVGLHDETGMVTIADVVRGQWDGDVRDEMIKQTARLDRDRYGMGLETCSAQDPGQAGKTDAAFFVKMLKGFKVHTEPESGDKELRAGPLKSQAEAGNVRLLAGPWNKAFLDEIVEFPGKYKDQVDSAANAYNRLALNVRVAPHLLIGVVGG